MVEILKRPNVLVFIGGLIAVLVGALLLKGTTEGMGLAGMGIFAMGNALKSVGQVMDESKARKSIAPDPVVEAEPDPAEAPTVPGKRGKS